MLEMVMFAVIFTGVQLLGGFLVMKYVMSEKFLKKYSKKVAKISMEMVDEMEL